jgi:hypothetical protein
MHQPRAQIMALDAHRDREINGLRESEARTLGDWITAVSVQVDESRNRSRKLGFRTILARLHMVVARSQRRLDSVCNQIKLFLGNYGH